MSLKFKVQEEEVLHVQINANEAVMSAHNISMMEQMEGVRAKAKE